MASEKNPALRDGRRITYVCMPGSPFTGSTLLGLLLNEHPECASIGAATGLIVNVNLSTYACSCGKLFRECEFWNHIAARTRALGHPVNVFETNFWNTHLRLSHDRLINALFVRSLGWDPLNDVREESVRRYGPGPPAAEVPRHPSAARCPSHPSDQGSTRELGQHHEALGSGRRVGRPAMDALQRRGRQGQTVLAEGVLDDAAL